MLNSEFRRILRQKLFWLEGFANGQGAPRLEHWVEDVRGLLNKVEQAGMEPERVTERSASHGEAEEG